MRNLIGKTMYGDETAAMAKTVGDTSHWRFSYLSALRIELQEIIEEVEMMMELCRKRQKSGEITNYVRWQNTALFTREIKGLRTLSGALDSIDPGRYETRDEMVHDIKEIQACACAEYYTSEERKQADHECDLVLHPCFLRVRHDDIHSFDK